MLSELKELWKFRELLFSMVRRDLKLRYKNSVLGFFWSLASPLATVVVMTFVFKYIMKTGVPNYSAYILAAYLPFMFFNMSLMDSSQSVLGSLGLIKKIYFPREILPLSHILSNFIHLILALGVFFLLLLFIFIRDPRISPFQATTIYLPLLLIINLCLATGIGLWLSALNVFYEDVKYITGIILYLLVFICPVMYFSEQVLYMFGEKNYPAYFIYHLNPVATLISAYRKVLLAPQDLSYQGMTFPAMGMDWTLLGITAAFSVFMLWYGYRTFNRLKWRFIERI